MDASVAIRDTADEKVDITIACYVNEVPPFIEAELARLYGSLHSSLPYFKVFRAIEGASCYVARHENQPVAILLFHYINGRIDVLNEMVEINREELARFVRYVFEKFPKANFISFKAIKADTHGLGFPLQRSHAKDTYMIELPATPQEYTASLGKSTRSTTRHQLNKIVRDYPSFTSRFYVDEEIDERQVREIIKFNEAKISSKAYKFSHDEKRILMLARMCGFVNVISIDGRVCAGSVNYRVGENYFGEVIGYDFSYEKSGIGKLALYLTICESIARGGKKFYLGGGRFDFKSRMLGTKLDMDQMEIYRSYPQLIFNFDKAATAAIKGYVRGLKVWLQEHKDEVWARPVFDFFYFWKNLRNK